MDHPPINLTERMRTTVWSIGICVTLLAAVFYLQRQREVDYCYKAGLSSIPMPNLVVQLAKYRGSEGKLMHIAQRKSAADENRIAAIDALSGNKEFLASILANDESIAILRSIAVHLSKDKCVTRCKESVLKYLSSIQPGELTSDDRAILERLGSSPLRQEVAADLRRQRSEIESLLRQAASN